MTKALQFKPDAWHTPEAQAYRERKETVLKATLSGLGIVGGAFSLGALLLSGLLSLTGAPVAAEGHLIFSAISGAVSLSSGAAVAPSLRRDYLAWKAADPAYQEVGNQLDNWLKENYGLAATDSNELAEWILEDGDEQTVKLTSAEGGLLEARMKRVEDGVYELRKVKISSPSESIYFEPVNSANSLTAARKPLALTAERS